MKFDEIVVNKKDFHVSKEGIVLDLVESSRIVLSDRFKNNEDGFKHFIGYLHVDDVIRPLCIVLPPMSGYIKYFDNGRKSMSFLIEDEDVYLKYTKKKSFCFSRLFFNCSSIVIEGSRTFF